MATKQTKTTLQGYSSVGQTEWGDMVESTYPGIDVTTEVGVVFINAGTNSVKKWNLTSALPPTNASFDQTGYTIGSVVIETGGNWWGCTVTSGTPTTSDWINLTALNSISDTDVDNITATPLSVISGENLKLLLESIDSALSARPTSVPDSSAWIDDDSNTDTDKGWSADKLYGLFGDFVFTGVPIIASMNDFAEGLRSLANFIVNENTELDIYANNTFYFTNTAVTASAGPTVIDDEIPFTVPASLVSGDIKVGMIARSDIDATWGKSYASVSIKLDPTSSTWTLIGSVYFGNTGDTYASYNESIELPSSVLNKDNDVTYSLRFEVANNNNPAYLRNAELTFRGLS